jgi:abequosyltransferase
MSDYKLSICIPTFNRAEYINELLKSIVCQDLQGVEVVVSDNASTDNTCDVLALYAKKYANIKYSLSETNLGADLNYFRAVEMASGEYCWIIGSDDCLDAGAIKFVLNVLSTNKDIYLQDRVQHNIKMEFPKRETWWKKEVSAEWDFSKDRPSDYFSQCISLGGVFSYLSSIVFRHDKWDSHIAPEKYYSTAYSHVYTLLSILKDRGTLTLLQGSGVLNRGGNDSFLDGGACQRRLIDFEGYKMLSEDLELTGLEEVLRCEHNVKTSSALFLGCLPFKSACAYMKRAGFNDYEIWLSFILSFIRRLLSLFKH